MNGVLGQGMSDIEFEEQECGTCVQSGFLTGFDSIIAYSRVRDQPRLVILTIFPQKLQYLGQNLYKYRVDSVRK